MEINKDFRINMALWAQVSTLLDSMEWEAQWEWAIWAPKEEWEANIILILVDNINSLEINTEIIIKGMDSRDIELYLYEYVKIENLFLFKRI